MLREKQESLQRSRVLPGGGRSCQIPAAAAKVLENWDTTTASVIIVWLLVVCVKPSIFSPNPKTCTCLIVASRTACRVINHAVQSQLSHCISLSQVAASTLNYKSQPNYWKRKIIVLDHFQKWLTNISAHCGLWLKLPNYKYLHIILTLVVNH